MNPKQSESKFSIQINPNQSDLGLIQTEFSIRINPNRSDLGFIRIDLDWSGLKTWFRTGSDSFESMFWN